MPRAHHVVLLLLLSACAASPAQSPSASEQTLFQLTNRIRVEHHLPPFAWNSNLARAARLHAARIPGEPGELLHQYPGEPDLVARAWYSGAHFETVSENIARHARSPAELASVWMSTPVHRANILNPRLDTIGIGIVELHGLLYAVQDFARGVPSLTREQVEQHVYSLLRSQGIATSGSSDLARQTCERNDTSAPHAQLVIHWDGSDLAHLPEAVLQQLQQHHFRSASVGACPSARHDSGFTTFHIALLLF